MDTTTHTPDGTGRVVERLTDHGDGTGTRTIYGPDGQVVSTEQVTGLPVESVESKTERSLYDRLRQALDRNRTYLALDTPTAAQQRAQVARLTRETSALIRLALRVLDADDDT